MSYFKIVSDEDGGSIYEYKTKEELLKDIDLESNEIDDCVNEIPDSDMNYWGDSFLIIKGDIITFRKKEVITKIDID